MAEDKGQEELLDYEDDEELVDAKVGDDAAAGGGKDGAAAGAGAGAKKGHYVGIHASGFRDFLLKPELLRAVVDCGFEHPSEVQHECIPQVCACACVVVAAAAVLFGRWPVAAGLCREAAVGASCRRWMVGPIYCSFPSVVCEC